jgi:dolichol-phosphate mannosyltransferase
MRPLIAIPVFNEARYVRGVVRQVRQYADDVLVIDDGSTDGTAEILDRLPGLQVIRHAENRGYGRSLIDAFAHAQEGGYDWIITLDCDDQHEPARIPGFLARAEADDVDIISGSRYLAPMAGNTPAPEDRRRINHVLTRLLNSQLSLGLTDAFCGFKAHRVAAMSRLRLTVRGYAFPLQFWVQVARHGLRVCELPVPLIYHDPTRHFGGILDDPRSRLAHYLEVFFREMARAPERDEERAACGCPTGR